MKRPNSSSYEKVTAKTVCCCKTSQRASQESSDVRRESKVRNFLTGKISRRPIFGPVIRRESDVRIATGFGKTFQIRVFLRPELEIGSKPFQDGSKSKNVQHES